MSHNWYSILMRSQCKVQSKGENQSWLAVQIYISTQTQHIDGVLHCCYWYVFQVIDKYANYKCWSPIIFTNNVFQVYFVIIHWDQISLNHISNVSIVNTVLIFYTANSNKIIWTLKVWSQYGKAAYCKLNLILSHSCP